MEANWSLVLNVIFLTVIFLMMYSRLKPLLRKTESSVSNRVASESIQEHDDIVSVHQIHSDDDEFENEIESSMKEEDGPSLGIDFASASASEPSLEPAPKTLMMFLVAKGPGVFAGYELLQTLLTCGLRFGEGGLFHRHQHASGQGPILFSLAAATETGVFDLHNMGAMTMKGLCIFMELSGNTSIDQERYDLFIQTANQLAQELGANMLDEKQQAVSASTYTRMQTIINHEHTFV
jgi:cell division protein ZipA